MAQCVYSSTQCKMHYSWHWGWVMNVVLGFGFGCQKDVSYIASQRTLCAAVGAGPMACGSAGVSRGCAGLCHCAGTI